MKDLANSNKIDLPQYFSRYLFRILNVKQIKNPLRRYQRTRKPTFHAKTLNFYVHYNTVMYTSTLQLGQTSFRHGCYTVHNFSLEQNEWVGQRYRKPAQTYESQPMFSEKSPPPSLRQFPPEVMIAVLAASLQVNRTSSQYKTCKYPV